LFPFIYGCVDPKDYRVIEYCNNCGVNKFRNDDIGHVITDVELDSEKKHQNIAYKSENKIRNADEQYGNSKILGKENNVELSHDKTDVHIDKRKKADISPKEYIYEKSAEESNEEPGFVAFNKCRGCCKYQQQIGCNPTKINDPKDSSLQYKR
jgi:hypothetical protein